MFTGKHTPEAMAAQNEKMRDFFVEFVPALEEIASGQTPIYPHDFDTDHHQVIFLNSLDLFNCVVLFQDLITLDPFIIFKVKMHFLNTVLDFNRACILENGMRQLPVIKNFGLFMASIMCAKLVEKLRWKWENWFRGEGPLLVGKEPPKELLEFRQACTALGQEQVQELAQQHDVVDLSKFLGRPFGKIVGDTGRYLQALQKCIDVEKPEEVWGPGGRHCSWSGLPVNSRHPRHLIREMGPFLLVAHIALQYLGPLGISQADLNPD